MTDEARRKAERTRAEFSETEEAFAGVRAAMVKCLFETKPDEQGERERLYLAVNVLDSVRMRMKQVITSHSDNKAIEDFVAALKQS